MDFWNALNAFGSLITAILTGWNLFCSCCSLIVLSVGGFFAYRQLKEANKNTLAQAYTPVWSYLQDPQVREARSVLFNIPEDCKHNISKWTPKEKEMAEIACSTYDVIAILITHKILEPIIIAKPWRDSIIRTWNSARPLIEEHRKVRDINYWKNFEELYNYAKNLPKR